MAGREAASEAAASNAIDCSIIYDYNKHDMCNGSFCQTDWNCQSTCCSWNECYADCNHALEWLWWTLSFLFLCLCISAMMGAARRRRMAAMRAAQQRNHHDCDVIIVQTQRSNQPVTGQPIPEYNAATAPQQQQAYYGQYQQPVMQGYYQPSEDASLIDPPPEKKK